ncbi:hypothetical protein JCM18909_3135 [Cutibacterium acnes JCM 18909]|nr:hypothetical protein JCM18909_3135 [Cutibacterium acnes JCM 18909]
MADRQEGPHAHQVTWLDRAHLAVTDLGADRINVVRWSEAGPEIIGSLKTLRDVARVTSPSPKMGASRS